MKLDAHTVSEIFRLRKAEHRTFTEIAYETGVSDRTVRRYLNRPEEMRLETGSAENRVPASCLDAHADLVKRLFGKFGYRPLAVREHLRLNGIKTSARTVQRYMKNHFENPAKKRNYYNELYFEPGEAAQTDFGECGTLQYGGTTRKLVFCVTVLCRSRYMYAEIIPSQKLEQFLSCLRHAAVAWRGVPRKLIVDNCRCAVISHEDSTVEWNSGFAEFCAHYSVKPVACTPRKPTSKGIVERMAGYIKSSFLAVSTFGDLAEANARLAEWLDGTANLRVHKTLKSRPQDVFDLLEKKELMALPQRPHACERVESRHIDSYGRISFEGNLYSVPSFCSTRQVTLKASPELVSIYYKGALAATHTRCYDSGQEIIDPAHVEKTRRALPAAMLQNARADFLRTGGDDAAVFLEELARRCDKVEPELMKLNALIRKYGPDSFRTALRKAIAQQAFRTEYLDWLLTQPEAADGAVRLYIPNSNGQMDIVTPEPNLDIYRMEN